MASLGRKETLVLAALWPVFLLAGSWVLHTKPTEYRAWVFGGISFIGAFYPIGLKGLRQVQLSPITFWLYLLQLGSSVGFLLYLALWVTIPR